MTFYTSNKDEITVITLIRPLQCKLADEIEQRLKGMVAAHDVMQNVATSLPYLLESGNVIKGAEAIQKFLETLEKELDWSRSISSDSCYLDPDGGQVC
ncbi:MAG: hypothetical protein AAGA85_15110 [Bacteroidota bacterium]